MSNQENTAPFPPDYLVEFNDADNDKPMLRKPGFDNEIQSIAKIDEILASYLLSGRKRRGWYKHDMAQVLGLSPQVYGRYERAFSKLTVAKLLIICEAFDIIPIEMLFAAAPHLWGATKDDADARFALAQRLFNLPVDTTKTLTTLLDRLGEVGGPNTETPSRR